MKNKTYELVLFKGSGFQGYLKFDEIFSNELKEKISNDTFLSIERSLSWMTNQMHTGQLYKCRKIN